MKRLLGLLWYFATLAGAQSINPNQINWGVQVTSPVLLNGDPTSTSATNTAATKNYRDDVGRSVRDYGAKCDGVTDDTVAFNTALNSGGGVYTITIPQAVCIISGPVVVATSNSNYPSLIGSGSNQSFINAIYTAWSGGAVQGIIEINSTGTVSNILNVHNRRFGGFTLEASGTIGGNTPVGIEVKTTASGVTSTNVQNYLPLYNATIDDILFFNLNLGINITEGWNLNLENLRGMSTTNGIAISGESVQVTVDKCQFGLTAGNGIGINVETKTYSDSVALQPEAVHVNNGSAFVGFQTDADIGAGYYVTLDNSVFDMSTGNTIIVGNPSQLWITNSYIAQGSNGSNSNILIQSPGSNIDGLWVEKNYIVSGSTSGTFGINFATGTVRRGVHIVDNNFHNLDFPIYIAATPNYSEIRGNYGAGNTGPFISFNTSGSGTGIGLSVVNNKSADSSPIIATSGALDPTYTQQDNYSATGFAPSPATQLVGYFTTTAATSDTFTSASSGASPAIATIPAGAHCTATAGNSTAAELKRVYIAPLATAGTVILSHSATAGGTFSISCAMQ